MNSIFPFIRLEDASCPSDKALGFSHRESFGLLAVIGFELVVASKVVLADGIKLIYILIV